jgi:hypothetical protein
MMIKQDAFAAAKLTTAFESPQLSNEEPAKIESRDEMLLAIDSRDEEDNHAYRS